MQHPLPCSNHAPRTAAFSSQIQHANRRPSRGQLQTLCAIKKKTEKNLVCSKTLTVKPDHKENAVKMCQEVGLVFRLAPTASVRHGCCLVGKQDHYGFVLSQQPTDLLSQL